MIDDSDGDFVLLSSGGSPILLALGIALAIVLYLIAAHNSDECGQRKCSSGRVGKLLDHECVCVELAKERR